MDQAKTEVLALTGFPRPHWAKVWSINPVRHEAPYGRGEVKDLPRRCRAPRHRRGERCPCGRARCGPASEGGPPTALRRAEVIEYRENRRRHGREEDRRAC